MPVVSLDITNQQPLAGGHTFDGVGRYVQIDGTAHFSVDPLHPANDLITDLKLAPRDDAGRVRFSADFRILRPENPQQGNHRIFFDILNRGRGTALRNFNNAPDIPADQPLDTGNGFLMRQGYTVVWCGWQHDAPDAPGIMRLNAPGALDADGNPISGRLVVTFQPNAPITEQFLSDRNHRPYPAADVNDPEAILTVQEHEDAPETVIPRQQWSFARMVGGQATHDSSYIYMADGFEPGKVYQVIYRTTGAPIVGLGLAATRDLASFLRYGDSADGNPCAGDIERVYTFGSSQSGRFLRDLLHLSMNSGEDGRVVFDGLIPHVAGAKHGEFNQRFAQPSSQASRSPNNLFPFSDIAQTDPETGVTDGVLARLLETGQVPKVMYTYTSSEYWGGGGSMVHVSLDGASDLEIPEQVRVYVFGSSQHPLGTPNLRDYDPANGNWGQQPFNCTDYRPLLRAALVNLDRWVTNGDAPPPSSCPRIAAGTAVAPGEIASTFAAIPGVNFPNPLRRFRRLDFGFTDGLQRGAAAKVPAVFGALFPNLVSAVDQDGNEVTGIRMPLIQAPLATHTGWNLRHAGIGGEGQILSSGGATGGTLSGSSIPFPPTRAEREASGDPRRSIEERYASRDDYLSRINTIAQGMVNQGYILPEDLELISEQASEHYDELTARVKQPQAADN